MMGTLASLQKGDKKPTVLVPGSTHSIFRVGAPQDCIVLSVSLLLSRQLPVDFADTGRSRPSSLWPSVHSELSEPFRFEFFRQERWRLNNNESLEVDYPRERVTCGRLFMPTILQVCSWTCDLPSKLTCTGTIRRSIPMWWRQQKANAVEDETPWNERFKAATLHPKQEVPLGIFTQDRLRYDWKENKSYTALYGAVLSQTVALSWKVAWRVVRTWIIKIFRLSRHFMMGTENWFHFYCTRPRRVAYLVESIFVNTMVMGQPLILPLWIDQRLKKRRWKFFRQTMRSPVIT